MGPNSKPLTVRAQEDCEAIEHLLDKKADVLTTGEGTPE